MGDIYDYDIVEGNNLHFLIQKVVKKICEGWQPLGAPVIQGSFYGQAMVKRNKEGE